MYHINNSASIKKRIVLLILSISFIVCHDDSNTIETVSFDQVYRVLSINSSSQLQQRVIKSQETYEEMFEQYIIQNIAVMKVDFSQ